jgi:hypothetical protein
MTLRVQLEINENGQTRIGTSEQLPPEIILNVLLDAAKLIAMQLAEGAAKPKTSLVIPQMSTPADLKP